MAERCRQYGLCVPQRGSVLCHNILEATVLAEHLRYQRSCNKTRRVYGRSFDGTRVTAQAAGHPIKNSDLPDFHPIARELDHWSVRQLIGCCDAHQTTCQETNSLAEIPHNRKTIQGTKTLFLERFERNLLTDGNDNCSKAGQSH